VATGREIQILSGHDADIRDVVFSHDGCFLASAGGDDSCAKVWDLASGKVLHDLNVVAHSGGTPRVSNVAFSPDGKHLAAAGYECMRCWDLTTGQPVTPFWGKAANAVAFSPNGEWLAAGNPDATVRVWHRVSGEQHLVLRGHPQDRHGGWIWSGISRVAFSPDGKLLATAAQTPVAMEVKVWDLSNWQQRWDEPSSTSAVSADGSRTVLAHRDRQSAAVRSVVIRDGATGKEVTLVAQVGEIEWPTVLSADGRLVASAASGEARSGEVGVWNAGTGQKTATLRGHAGEVYSLALSGDGHYLASGGNRPTGVVWDPRTGREVFTFPTRLHSIGSLAFSSDGSQLAAVSRADQSSDENEAFDVTVWDTATGKERFRRSGRSDIPPRLTFSRDGGCLAFSRSDWHMASSEVVILDASTGRERMTLRDAGPLALSFSPDGQRLATQSFRGISLWDTNTGLEVLGIPTDLGGGGQLAFSGDGFRLFSFAGRFQTYDATPVEVRAVGAVVDLPD
jgi:WD40 repeat protein